MLRRISPAKWTIEMITDWTDLEGGIVEPLWASGEQFKKNQPILGKKRKQK
jgi:hypothetical protein